MEQNFLQDYVISSIKRHSFYEICYYDYSEQKQNNRSLELISDSCKYSDVSNDVHEVVKIENEELFNDSSDQSNIKTETLQNINLKLAELLADNNETKILKEYVKKPTIFIPGAKLMFSGLHESDESPKLFKNIFNWVAQFEFFKT